MVPVANLWAAAGVAAVLSCIATLGVCYLLWLYGPHEDDDEDE